MSELNSSVDRDPLESAESISLIGSSSSSRRRWLLGAAAGAAGVALLVVAVAIAAGDDAATVDAKSPSASVGAAGEVVASTRSSAPVSVDVSRLPAGYPDWQSGIELAKTTLPSGEVLRFVE